jgi:hypothetical protein
MNYISLGVFLLLLAGYTLYITRLLWFSFVRLLKGFCKSQTVGASLMHIFANDSEDGDYNLLWQTQLPALELLNSAGSCGVSLTRMTKLYREIARVYPEIYDGSTFQEWLDALQNATVAVHCRAEGIIAITEKGRFILTGLERRCVIHYAPQHFYERPIGQWDEFGETERVCRKVS